MTDAGGFELDDAASCSDERERLLRQIAGMLDLPLSIFHRRRAAVTVADSPTSDECATMLAAFSRIRDPEIRKQCLATLQRCADAEADTYLAVRPRTSDP